MALCPFDASVQKLIDALGLRNVKATKFVLEVDAQSDEPVKLYVVSLVEAEQVAAVAAALAGLKVIPARDVEVDDHANVFLRPR